MCKAIENTNKSRQNIARSRAAYAFGPGSRWTYGDIYDAYERPSREKVRAWEYCERLCYEMNGYDLRIASRNTFQFSAVFKFEDDDGAPCYAYITRDYDSFCRA